MGSASLLGKGSSRPSYPRLILRKRDVAQALGYSVRTLNRMLSTGEAPPSDMVLRGRKGWRTSTIQAWVEAGCPPQSRNLGA